MNEQTRKAQLTLSVKLLQWVQEGLIPGDEKENNVKMLSKKVLLYVLHISSTAMVMNEKAVKKVKTYKHLKIIKFLALRFS